MLEGLPGPFGILETAAAMAFVYFMLSLICSSVNETFASLLNLRAKNLSTGIKSILHDTGTDDDFATAFFNHALIQGMAKKSKLLPSWLTRTGNIPAQTFAMVVQDLLKSKNGDQQVVTSGQVPSLNNPVLEQALKAVIDEANGEIDKVRVSLESWYDTTMIEVRTWYKAKVQRYMVAIGFILAVVLNVNSIAITEAMITQPAMRTVILAQAEQATLPSPFPPHETPAALGGGDASQVSADEAAAAIKQDLQNLQAMLDKFDQMKLPIGWESGQWDKLQGQAFWMAVLGWILTGIAVSFGAPFWFHLLNRLMAIRGGLQAPQASDKPEPRKTDISKV